MFYDEQLNFLHKMLEKCNITCRTLNAKQKITQSTAASLLGKSAENKCFYDFFPYIKSNAVYYFADIFLCRYIFLLLPNTPDKVVIIGPYINFNITQQQVLEQSEALGIHPTGAKELEYFYASVPVVTEENHIFAIINTFAEFIWGTDNFENIEIDRGEWTSYILPELTDKFNESNIEKLEMMEKRYAYENELMAAVSQGNLQKAELMMSNFSLLAFEDRVPDRLRNIKNYCIIMNTLFRKAAQSGGVHPIYLDKTSSELARKIEGLQSLAEVTKLMPEILRRYCRLVKHHSVKNYSPLVQKAVILIDGDINGDLSLSEIARKNNVSPSYFSALFKKETGYTLTEYVNSKRVDYAKYLLKNTNLQIQTIAQHCGILDFHYFCRIFKKFTGKTPTEFKRGII